METTHRVVVIMRGIPGSGKSTYSKKLVSEEGYNRISKDDIREMINSYKLNNADEGIVHDIQTYIVKKLMLEGRNFVVDNTHAKKRYLDDLVAVINELNDKIGYDYEIQIKTMDTPLEECLRRNSLRVKPVFEEVIRKMHKDLESSKDYVI